MHPVSGTPEQPPRRATGSRARTGGSVRPVGAPGAPEVAPAVAPLSTTDTERPPSFAPTGRTARPVESGARPIGGGAPRSPGLTERPPTANGVGPSPTGARPDGPRTPPFVPSGDQAGPRAATSPKVADSAPSPRTAAASRRRIRRRRLAAVIALAVALVLAWPVGLVIWANGKVQHVDALSGGAGTPGEVYLLAGSDSRADGVVSDGTEGQRTDTIMLLTIPSSGTTSLISIPRDTYVDIPGHGPGKLNASFSYGGAPLLVQTVEQITGMKVDHYVEVGMGGVQHVVDAVGGVELCLDYDVDDPNSQLVWTAGCHVADGATALAFSRMRYSDPLGDIGRTQRQQQVISAVTHKVATPATLLSPSRQVDLIRTGTGVLMVDQDTGIIDLARMALAFRAATGPDGARGTPPIADNDYRPGGVGSTVLLDAAALPAFFQQVQDGSLTPAAEPGEPAP